MSNQSLPSQKSTSSTKNTNTHHLSQKEVTDITTKSTATLTQNQSTTSMSSEEGKTERKRYKILAGNGCHQAIAEIKGILVPPSEPEQPFTLILPDGLQIEATFKTARLYWIAQNKEYILGLHWFRGYPKMKDDKLISLQIIAWDGNMPSNPTEDEHWEFIGIWTAQKNLTVQRSMMTKDIRKIAKETGFIKKFKYTFLNSYDWAKSKKLWIGYVYKILCVRKGDKFEIKKVIPYACPRIKPVPKTNRGKTSYNNKSNSKPDKKD